MYERFFIYSTEISDYLLYLAYFTLLYFALLYFTLLYFTLLYFTLLRFTLDPSCFKMWDALSAVLCCAAE